MNKQRGYTVNELLIVIFGLSVLGLVVTGIVVACHFIVKFW